VREGRADELDRPHQVGRDRVVDLGVVSGGSGSHRMNRAKSWTFAPEGSTRRFHSERSLLSAPSAADYGDVPTPAPKRTQTLVATLALVGATAIWGSTFLVTKQSLPEMSPASFLVWRFGLAAIALLVARPRQLVTLTRAELHRGLLLGVFLGSGFLLQTIGLLDTDAGVSGFLTGPLLS
jgi:hypothetical protein